MMKDTSYSKIPSNYGLCAADCPRGDTCLRRIAYDRIPANVVFPPTLHLKAIEAMAGKCKYYRSNEKVRYARVPVYGRSLGGQCVGYVQVSSDR